jgi:Kef-type K+ transport system membrane component KefB
MILAAGPVAPATSHESLIFLLQVGLLLSAAFLLGRLAMRLSMPAIVGELLAGVLFGPSVLAHVLPRFSAWLLPHDLGQTHMLDAVGQFGVLLLVGITGAQMDLGLVRRKGATAVRISIAGLIVPLGLGIGVGLLLPSSLVPHSAHRSTFALFLGVAMGLSAIPVIAKTLMDMRLLHRNVGQLTLCAGMVDDTIGWVLLSVVSIMATTSLRAGDVGVSLGYLAMVIIAAVLVRPVIRTGIQLVGRSKDSAPTVAFVTCLVLLGAALTQALKLEAVFGAFIVGIVISSTKALDPERIAPLRVVILSVLAPLFFATAGLRMDLTALAKPTVLLTGLVVLFIAITGKFVGGYTGARLSRLGHWESFALGAGINARGVVEVIVALVGLRLGVLSAAMYTIIVLVAIVTSLMAPPLLRYAMARVDYTTEERLRAPADELDQEVAQTTTA